MKYRKSKDPQIPMIIRVSPKTKGKLEKAKTERDVSINAIINDILEMNIESFTDHKPNDNKTIYLANAYGFSQHADSVLLPEVIDKLESLGLEVWEPFRRNNDHEDPYEIGQGDLKDVTTADAIFAIVNGCPPDEGVMVELGIATALKKPIFLFRDDSRKCGGDGKYPINLMAFTGLPRNNWEYYYFTSVNTITSPHSAVRRWAEDPDKFNMYKAGEDR